jgi:hypothetical protein
LYFVFRPWMSVWMPSVLGSVEEFSKFSGPVHGLLLDLNYFGFMILEQYFKRHPSTHFNKTPSANYILL